MICDKDACGTVHQRVGRNANRLYTDGSRTTELERAGLITEYSRSLGGHVAVFQTAIEKL